MLIMYKKNKLIHICNEIFDFLQNKEINKVSIGGAGMDLIALSKKEKKELAGNIKVGKKYSISYSWDGYDNIKVTLVRENLFILTSKGNILYEKSTQANCKAIMWF